MRAIDLGVETGLAPSPFASVEFVPGNDYLFRGEEPRQAASLLEFDNYHSAHERILLKLGLTGGIASGKSAVGEMFVKLGARLIQSDAVARELMQPGRPVYVEVVRRFGREILNADESINRSRLAESAFGSESPRFKELNAIVHPAVIAEENNWMKNIGERDRNAIAIVEAALILEAGAAGRFDHLIVVTCQPEQRIIRYAKRMAISEAAARAEVSRRMAAQISDDEKTNAADFVIDNSGSLDATESQVQRIFATLRPQANQ